MTLYNPHSFWQKFDFGSQHRETGVCSGYLRVLTVLGCAYCWSASSGMSLRSSEKDLRSRLLGPVSESGSSLAPGEDRSVVTLLMHLVVAVAFSVGSLVVGLSLIGHFFEQPSAHPDYFGVPRPAHFVGVLFLVFGLPVGVLGLGLLAGSLARMRQSWGLVVSRASVLLLGVVELIWAVTAFFYLVTPSRTYNAASPPDALWQLIGGFQVAVFVPLGIATLVIAWRMRAPRARLMSRGRGRAVEDVEEENEEDGEEEVLDEKWSVEGLVQPDTLMWNAWRIGGVVVVLVLVFLGCVSLTNVWNFSAHSYFTYDSPYSLTHFHIGQFVPKVYEDTVVYFAFVALLVACGVATYISPAFRSTMHSRLPLSPTCLRLPHAANRLLFDWWWPWDTGVSVGELFVLGSVTALYIYWIQFWGVRYDRIRTEAALDDLQNDQIAARVVGHVLTLTMSFLLLPATRNSALEAVFAIPFERVLKYHRLLGGLTWLLTTLHMLIWWGKWARQSLLVDGKGNTVNLLANNIATIDNFHPDPANGHWDNFTVLIAELAWLGLTVMVLSAIFDRRSNYERFQTLHYFGIVFFVVGVVHAWGFWYYTAGGMLLWLADRCVRLIRASSTVRVVSVEHGAGVTRVKLRPEGVAQRFAGQFAFVNIPAISEHQWHPFTISSPPSHAEWTFHVRDMGDRTWTHDLTQLAKSRDPALCPSKPALLPPIRVDGPYGRTASYTHASKLLLIAGGIGITPLHSILADLLARTRTHSVSSSFSSSSSSSSSRSHALPASLGSIRHVHLVWCARDPSLFNIFAETLFALAHHNPNDMFRISLHDTRVSPAALGADSHPAHAPASAAASAVEEVRFTCPFSDVSTDAVQWVQRQVVRRRPGLGALFQAAVQDVPVGDSEQKVMALVCGPRAMIEEVSDLAFQYSCGFHAEEFYF